MTITAFPLQWPTGWPRAHPAQMRRGKFGVRSYRNGSSYKSLNDITVSEATRRILFELETMDIDSQDVVISTNVKLRLDGLPRSGEKEPDDSGAAVYWVDGGASLRTTGWGSPSRQHRLSFVRNVECQPRPTSTTPTRRA